MNAFSMIGYQRGWWVLLLCALGLALPSVRAHDFWVDAEATRDTASDRFILTLGSGHHFPRNDGPPNPRLVHRLAWQDSDGGWHEVSTGVDGRDTVEEEPHNLYRTLLILQPPRAPRPVYTSQSLFKRAWQQDESWPVPLGRGVEFSLILDLTGQVQVQVLRDGEPVPATVIAYAPDTRPVRVTTGRDEPGRLAWTPGTPLLLTTSVGPQSGSLLLNVPPVPPEVK